MRRENMFKRTIPCVVCAAVVAAMLFVSACGSGNPDERKIDKVVSEMTMDEKISQMIIPSIRTWNEENVTDLDAVPELKAALQKHQYGGVILFGGNITGNEQMARLTYELQDNNMQMEGVTEHIPYLLPVDEEGGIVIRFSNGTRMNGNMAIGATKDAVGNAEKTGKVLGEEIAAAGFNADFAPDIDVNNNPNNPVIGTRSFSDDPDKVAEMGIAYTKGLAQSNVIATYKHFPGHGDTGTDSHIGTPSVEKTYEEIKANELVPFKKAIESGADMIMTAHITFPLIDEEVTYGDGVTKGFYPATMSKKMITDILRTDMGFKGVVVTDALEMAAINEAGLVPGAQNSVEYGVNIAKEIINAGVDILLLPIDLTGPELVTYYDEYIAGIAAKVESGEISEDRINESVKRILMLKAKYDIYKVGGDNAPSGDVESRVLKSVEVVGSKEHHEIEMDMARQAITLVKNDNNTLPVSKEVKKIFVLGRLQNDETTLSYAVQSMKDQGFIAADAEISYDYYYESSGDDRLHYTDEIKEKATAADMVFALSYASGSSALDKENAQFIALHNAISDTHSGGGKFVLISENLPYDAAIYQDADAILLAYLGSALGTDPTEREKDTAKNAINSNIIAAIDTAFGASSPAGILPVNIPKVEENADGSLEYAADYLYERGHSLSY